MMHKKEFWGLVLLIIGLLFLLGNLEVISFSLRQFFHLLIPIILILIGIYLLTRYFRQEDQHGLSVEFTADDDFPSGRKFNKLFDNLTLDMKGMEIDGVASSVEFGSNFMSMTGAKLKPGINRVRIASTFGDVTILVPKEIEARAFISSTFGSIDAFGKSSSGISNRLTSQTEGYDGAESKVDITARTTFGDVKIYRA